MQVCNLFILKITCEAVKVTHTHTHLLGFCFSPIKKTELFIFIYTRNQLILKQNIAKGKQTVTTKTDNIFTHGSCLLADRRPLGTQSNYRVLNKSTGCFPFKESWDLSQNHSFTKECQASQSSPMHIATPTFTCTVIDFESRAWTSPHKWAKNTGPHWEQAKMKHQAEMWRRLFFTINHKQLCSLWRIVLLKALKPVYNETAKRCQQMICFHSDFSYSERPHIHTQKTHVKGRI